MSMKDKRVKSVVESDDENEPGACGVSNDPRRFSLAVPEPAPGNLLEESVDNLSMEVHLGGDSSRHPSEISSVSYQNLLEDGEPSNSIISRRGSDDSLDSYPPDFPDAELPPDDLETFEASDLPLSEHFPMGAIQGADSREKSRGDRSSYVSDNSSNLSHHNVRLKDQPHSDTSENVKLRDKNKNDPSVDTDEASAKRSSLEIRNNIPVIGEVKDYEKELNIDFNRAQGHKTTLTGLKQSPGVARRVDIETQADRDSSGTDDVGKQSDSRLPSASGHQHPTKLRSKKTSSKSKENVIEVITPIPRNINVENEYDYVKYARVQQGNSYVGMRLAYSSSSDSLNIKQGVFSEDNSREPSPEKNIQQKILPDNGNQDKVCEETLMEIPLNTNDYTEDKKAFTLSPENTECDSVEVESVTSEGGNSTPGFPMLEDGLSSSQASDVDEGGSGIGNDRSPSRLIKSKQKAAIEQDILKDEEDCRPKEIDAQAIMNDLKMKREALDMAIADIKSAIQRSKSMSLESAYSDQTEPDGTQPVWVKRVNKEAANLAQRRQEEMRRVQEEIERQHEEIAPSQGKSHQDLCEREKFIEACAAEGGITVIGQRLTSADTEWQKVNSDTSTCTDATCETYDNYFTSPTKIVKQLPETSNEQVSSHTHNSLQLVEDSTDQTPANSNIVDHEAMYYNQMQITYKPEYDNKEYNLYNMHEPQHESSSFQEPVFGAPNVPDRDINVDCDSEKLESANFQNPIYRELHGDSENSIVQTVNEIGHLSFEDGNTKNVVMSNDKSYPKEETKFVYLDSAIQSTPNNQILSFGSWGLKSTKIDNRQSFVGDDAVNKQTHSFTFQGDADNQLSDHTIQEDDCLEAGVCFKKSSDQPYTDSDVNDRILNNNIESSASKLSLEFKNDCESVRHRQSSAEEVREEKQGNWAAKETDDDLVDSVRMDGRLKGYDSDDECEDAEGIRYTRRIKGIKYAPLQIDDSLEMGETFADSGRDVAKSNGHTLSNKLGSHLGSNGSLVSHKQPQSQSGEHHIHSSETPLSSEENSDIDANITSYTRAPNADSDTDEETDRLLQKQYQERDKNVEIPELSDPAAASRRSEAEIRHSKAKEAAIRDPDRPEVLIEGVLFRARYLGSTQLISEGQPSKAMRMMQAQEAVGRIKAPEGENQPSTDVDLFVSTEKIMVLNTDLQEIMMDHSLRTISYIADIGDILVIMARRRLITSPDDMLGRRRRQAKILCHVFESDEAQLIAQSIGQAFQVAYLEFLKANGIEDPGLLKEMDYQDVLNQQEIYGEELNLFANKDFHKEVIVPKSKNEPLGVVIVESGWGSMVPTVVLANMLPTGPAARCGQLNIGDQIISINGISLVGLPLSACQTYIKASRSQTVVKLTVVPCPPVVEVLIKRPDVKYQLGFSVQNGVICSLLRGGIAERGGVRVGHRIIEINNQSVVAVPHEKIVTLLASSVGEIHMKTMPTSIFRLLTGQDVPHYL